MSLNRIARRQSSFAAGELSPRALGRADSPAYARGLAQCRNWIINPQGSLPRRAGTKHIGITKTLSPFATVERASSTGAFDLNAAVYASELKLWIAVGNANGTNPVIVKSSDDGLTWEVAGTIPALDFNLFAVTWSGSLFVAVGAFDGATKTTIFTSTDGDTWIDRSVAMTGTPDLRNVLWSVGLSLFIASGDSMIASSTDGTTWTERSTVIYDFLRGSAHNEASGQTVIAGKAVWVQVGNDLNIPATGEPAITALSATRIAFFDNVEDDLRTYDFDGTDWVQVGNDLNIPGAGTPAIAALSATRIAYIDDSHDDLRTYDFDGTDWAQVGNDLNITGVANPALAALSATRVAFIDDFNDDLRTYDFDGTDWTQTGNDLIVANTNPAITALSSTRIAFIDSFNDDLRTYDFDGTDWAQVGNDLVVATVGVPALAALSSKRVAFIDNANDDLRTYDFDGTDWVQVSSDLNISAVGGKVALAALSSTRVAFIDDTNADLRTYDWDGAIAQSTNGTSYTTLNAPDEMDVFAALFDGSNFYLAGEHTTLPSPAPPATGNEDGAIVRGTGDGTWTEVYANGSGSTMILALARFGDFLVAVGEVGLLVSSQDNGATWTTETDIETLDLNGAAFGNGRLTIVGEDDTTDAQLFQMFESTTGRRLVAFSGATGSPYMLEFGHLYIRFWRDGISVESSPGTPLEITTPWSGGEVLVLQFAQANDIMYLTHPDFSPRKLTRTGEATFTLVDTQDVSSLPGSYLLIDGPYQAENATTTTINPSGVSGSITLTASTSIFASTDVGRTVRLFEDPEWGWLVITAFTSGLIVTATVTGANLANSIATSRWALGAFSATTGFPAAISFYQQRLVYAATDSEPQGVWTSVVASFEEYSPTQFDDIVVEDNALVFSIASRRLSRIRWLSAASSLTAGTASGPFIINGTANNASISPISLNVRLASEYDASSVLPGIVGNVVVYAQSGGLRIRGLDPGQRDIFGQPDLTLLSDQVTESGVLEMAFSAIPSSVLWMVRNDGKLIGLTIHHEAENAGWHLHTIGGDLTGSTEPKVLSIANLPSEGFDQLYMIVRRSINSVDVEYIEALQFPFSDSEIDVDLEDAWHLDSAIKYDGPSTTAITGLDHLEGETVRVFADGVMQADKTVSSGAITIATAASVVLVGLGYDSDMQVVPLRFLDVPGAAVQPFGSVVEVFETSGLQIGPDTSNLVAVALDTGLNTKDVDARFEAPSAATMTRPQYVIRSKDALPATLLSLTHRIEVETQP